MHFNTENFNQFYVLSLGIDGAQSSSLQISEIFDAPDNNPIPDDMLDIKTIVESLIHKVESQFENIQNIQMNKNVNSKIPLLRSRQR